MGAKVGFGRRTSRITFVALASFALKEAFRRAYCQPLLLVCLLLQPAFVHAAENDPPFVFVQITDLHFSKSPERTALVEQTVEEINALDPPARFVAATGDLVDGDYAAYDKLQQLLGRLKPHVVYQRGNHDSAGAFCRMQRETGSGECEDSVAWSEHNYGFTFLNSVLAGRIEGALAPALLTRLKDRLPRAQVNILFMHHNCFPADDWKRLANCDRLIALLEELRTPAVVIAGHSHKSSLHRHGRNHFITTRPLAPRASTDRSPPGYRVYSLAGEAGGPWRMRVVDKTVGGGAISDEILRLE